MTGIYKVGIQTERSPGLRRCLAGFMVLASPLLPRLTPMLPLRFNDAFPGPDF